MDWIDETVAIGSWMDAHCVRALRREKIDLIIDSRTLFSRPGTFRNEPDIDLVKKAADTMVELSRLNVKVLAFCRHGRDRSPFLAAVYFSKRYGLPYDEAYRLIMRKRPRTIYHPEWVEMMNTPKPR